MGLFNDLRNGIYDLRDEIKEELEYKRVLKEVKEDWRNLEKYFDKYASYPDIIKAGIEQDGMALQYAAKHIKTKELVLMAVKNNGYAIQFADELRRDRDVIEAALQQDPGTYIHIKDYVRTDKELSLFVLKKLPHLQHSYDISYDVREQRKKALEEVRRDGLKLETKWNFQDDKELVLIAVKQNGMALQYAEYSLKNDRDVVLAALEQNIKAYEFVPETLIEQDKEVKKCVKGCKEAIEKYEKSFEKAKSQVIKDATELENIELYRFNDEEKRAILLSALSKSSSEMKNIGFVLQIVDEKYSEFSSDSQVKYYIEKWEIEAERRAKENEEKRKEEEETKLRIEKEKEEKAKLKRDAKRNKEKSKILEMVREDGMNLGLSECIDFTSDKDVILAAVKQNYLAIKFVNFFQFSKEDIIELVAMMLQNNRDNYKEVLKLIKNKWELKNALYDADIKNIIESLEHEKTNDEKVNEETEGKTNEEAEEKVEEKLDEIIFKGKNFYSLNRKAKEMAQSLIIELVTRDGGLLGKVPDYLQNEDIVKAAVTNNWRALKFVDNKFRIPEIFEIALSQSLAAEEFLTEDEKRLMVDFINKIKEENREKARQEREALKAKIAENWEELKNIEEYNQDEELVMIALKQNIMAYKYISPSILQSNNKVRRYMQECLDERESEAYKDGIESYKEIIKIIKEDGMALQFVKENQTRKMVEDAVKQNGMALQYADPQFVDLALAELAVKQNPKAIEFVFNFIKEGNLEFNQCRSLIFNATKEDGHTLKFLVDYVKESNGNLEMYSDIISNAIEQDGDALQYIKGENAQKYGDVLEAIKKDGLVIRHVDDRLLKESHQYGVKQLEEWAVEQNGMALEFIEKPKPNIIAIALRQNGMALQFVDLKHEKDERIGFFVSIAIEQDKNAAQFVTDEIMKKLSPELCKTIEEYQEQIKENEADRERIEAIKVLKDVRQEYDEKIEIVNDNERIISALEEKIKAVKERIGELNEIKQDIGLEK